MFGSFFSKKSNSEEIPLINEKKGNEESYNQQKVEAAFSERVYQGVSYVWSRKFSIIKAALASAPLGISNVIEAYFTSTNNFHTGYEAGSEQALSDLSITGNYNNSHSQSYEINIKILGYCLGFTGSMLNIAFGYRAIKLYAKGELSKATWQLVAAVATIGTQTSISSAHWFNVDHGSGEYFGYENTWNNNCQYFATSNCPNSNVTLNDNDYQLPAWTDNAGVKCGLSALASTVGLFAGAAIALREEIVQRNRRRIYEEISDPISVLKS